MGDRTPRSPDVISDGVTNQIGYSQSRWLLGLLMAGGVLITYVDRVNISHALSPLATETALSPLQQGLLLSAFSWGYVLFMLPGGLLVDTLKPVRVLTLAAIGWSVATLWTGISNGFVGLLGSRLALGIAEAPVFPANARLVRQEFPLTERGRAIALFDAASYAGVAVSAPLIVAIILHAGWRHSFVASAALGLFWLVLWSRFAPRLSRNSHGDLEGQTRATPLPSIWRLMRERSVVVASIGFFCYNYPKNFFLTWLPTYLLNERGFGFSSLALFAAIPALCAIAGDFLGGLLSDTLLRRGQTLSVARRVPLLLGLGLTGFIAFADFIDSKGLVIALLCFAFAANSSAAPAIWAIPGDIAPTPELVGRIGAIQNTFANVAGIIAPIVTGFLLARFGSFQPALFVSGAVAIVGAGTYWLFLKDLKQLAIALPTAGA